MGIEDKRMSDEFLFDMSEIPVEKNPMAHRVGVRPGEKCKNCKYFLRTESNAGYKFFKCKVYGVSNGSATDWRANYNACSLFERKQK